METEGGVEKQRTVFPHLLAKRLRAFRTVPTGSTVVSPQTTKPDISLATNTGHFYLLPTWQMPGPNATGSLHGLSRIPYSIGHDGADADNFKRNEFNELVRRAHGSEDIFDIAKVESIRPDGRLEGFQTGSTFYSSPAHEFSNDGGHLNKMGSRLAAREFLRAISVALAARNTGN